MERAPNRHMRFLLIILLCQLVFPLNRGQSAGSEGLTLDQRRAGLLIQFARYTKWPEASLPDQATPLRIGIVGSATVHQWVTKLAEGITVHGDAEHPGRIIQIHNITSAEEAATCHLVYLGANADPGNAILQQLAAKPVLTVGEEDGFLGAGGVLGYVTEKEAIGFIYNGRAMDKAGLRISTLLLDRALKSNRKGDRR